MPSPLALRTVVSLLAAALAPFAAAQQAEKRYAPEAFASSLAAALAVPVTRSAADEGNRDGEDDAAIRHFVAAAREGADAIVALLTIAATTPDVQVARRALTAAAAVVDASSRDRAVPLLLGLVEHSDQPVASMAAEALDRHVGEALPQSVRQIVVARAMARWPANELELRWQWRHSASMGCPGPRPSPKRCWVEGHYEVAVPAPTRLSDSVAMHVPSRLVRAAAATGSRKVIHRLMARTAPGARPDPSDARIGLHEGFIRACLRLAAPNVDAETARLMHGWFLPDLATWKAPGTPNSGWPFRDGWTDSAFDVIANLFGNVPDDLLPSYAPLLRDETTKLELRRRLRRVDAIPADRVRQLLLPLDRERDRSLLLCAPNVVAAALRGNDAEQQRLVDVLSPPRTGLCEITARHWHTLLPAIMELPDRRRCHLLDRLSLEFRRLAVDVEPFEQTSLRRAADQRD